MKTQKCVTMRSLRCRPTSCMYSVGHHCNISPSLHAFLAVESLLYSSASDKNMVLSAFLSAF